MQTAPHFFQFRLSTFIIMGLVAATLLGANIFHAPTNLENYSEARKELERARGEELREYGWPLIAAKEKLTVIPRPNSPEGIADIAKSLEWNFTSLAANIVISLLAKFLSGVLIERVFRARNTTG